MTDLRKELRLAACVAIWLTAFVSGGAEISSLSGSGWTADGTPVTVPHCWNVIDGCDGKGVLASERFVKNSSCASSYERKRVVYQRELPNPTRGKRQFVKAEGASVFAEVSVNGKRIGDHLGAFTAFAFEVTEFLKPSGNVLEIAVDNFAHDDSPPVNADFTMYGGLYRDVWFMETDPICIDRVTDGASGVRVTADADTGDVTVDVSVLGGTNEVQRFHFRDYRLWSPELPQMYSVTVKIDQGGSHDETSVSFGFRKAEFRSDGFYLNGIRRKIRGVNYHQDAEGRGWAVSREEKERDILAIKDLGADGVRTAHYPHSGLTYDLCDRKGVLVWCEHPNVNGLRFTENFKANSWRQAREMIVQLANHPSIVCWSIFNELYNKVPMTEGDPEKMMEELREYVKRLDPTRPVAAASDRPSKLRLNAVPAVLGFNRYPGWYGREGATMRGLVDEICEKNGRTSVGLTEYGAGGSAGQHGDAAVRCEPYGDFHSEEYQAFVHVNDYRDILADSRIWGSFVWCMFDFGSDCRLEGACHGRNDKGLMTFDHRRRKEAWWFYRANWREEPVLHLVGGGAERFVTNATATVLAFSNVGDVSLRVNGRPLGQRTPDSVRSVCWRDVHLDYGRNDIVIESSGRRETSCWFRTPVLSPEEGDCLVRITSSHDGTEQPCYFWAPERAKGAAVPLIVGLHTWSGDLKQVGHYETVLRYAMRRGWAFVGPNFRGANSKPEACGGDAAVQDIVDAVNYAKAQVKIDPKRVYIIGGSGGGHMALLMAGRHPEIWAGCAAFCPITDLARWHADSLEEHPGRERKYARMLEKSCGGRPDARAEEYRRRSPLTWIGRAREAGVPVYIVTGIHDGWKGSVPVGHSFRAFNALAETGDRIDEADIAVVEKTQAVPDGLAYRGPADPFYDAKRRIHFRRASGNVRLTIFEGAHGGNFAAGFDFLSRQEKGMKADFSLPNRGTGDETALGK